MKKLTFLISLLFAWSALLSQTYVKPSGFSTATRNSLRSVLGIDTLLTPVIIKNSKPPDFIIRQRSSILSVFPTSDSVTVFSSINLNTLLDSCFSLLVPNEGGKILLSPMNYDSLTFVNFQSDNVTIEGTSRNLVVLTAKDSLDHGVTDTYKGIFHFAGYSHITIRNITLDGNCFNMERPEASDGIGIHGFSNFDSSDRSSSYCLISNCTLRNISRDGVSITGSNNVIKDCWFDNCYWNGPTFLTSSYSCSVINCNIKHMGDVGISAYGKNHMIAFNVIDSIDGTHGSLDTRWGIGLETNAYDTCRYSTVVGNKISNVRIGLQVNKGYYNLISNNYIYYANDTIGGSPLGYGIVSSYGAFNSYHSNTVVKARTYGIKVQLSDSCLFTNNYVSTDTTANAVALYVHDDSNYNTFKGGIYYGQYRGLAIPNSTCDYNRFVICDFKGIDGNAVADFGTNSKFFGCWDVKTNASITDVW